MASFAPKLTAHGAEIPAIGFGTSGMGDVRAEHVATALKVGYRHIDTARKYGTEGVVGEGMYASGVPRTDIFLCTKVSHENLHAGDFARSVEQSLAALRVDYVDLLLVHWPEKNTPLAETMGALAKAKREGLTRHIGVANFNIALLKTVIEDIRAPIACNQVEYHVMLDQTPLRKYLASKAIPLVAYCPLAQGRVAGDPTLAAIGRKHGASAAQVALKWLLDQDGVAAIPKASRSESQRANLDAQHIGLDDEDRQAIAALPKDRRCVNPGFAPVWD